MNIFRGILVISTLIVSTAYGQSIETVGHKLQASANGVDTGGSIFLLNDVIIQGGVLFAYSAYFRTNKPMRFQVWRPTTGGNEISHKLIAETPVIPSVVMGREDVYIASKLTEKCVKVQANDRLGLYFEEGPGSVAYVFDTQTPRAQGYTLPDINSPVVIGSTVDFNSVPFPYDFSVMGYIDTNLNAYENSNGGSELFPDCRNDVLIPEEVATTTTTTTTTPIPSGAPGALGATGPRGAIGATGLQGVQGATGAEGQIGAAGADGEVGATGPRGAIGATGAQGDQGATGPTGAKGDKGDEGEMGPVGPAGPPGEVFTVQVPIAALRGASTGEEAGMMEFLSSPYVTLGLLIGLGVVTLIVLALVIAFCCCRQRNNPVPTLPRMSSQKFIDDSHSQWVASLKDGDTDTIHSHGTIDGKLGQKGSISNLAFENEVTATSSTDNLYAEIKNY